MQLLFMGTGARELRDRYGLDFMDLGFIEDDAAKAQVYAAADLLVLPCRNEVFGNVGLESIACGTPVAAFDVGGVALTSVLTPPIPYGLISRLLLPPGTFRPTIVA